MGGSRISGRWSELISEILHGGAAGWGSAPGNRMNNPFPRNKAQKKVQGV